MAALKKMTLYQYFKPSNGLPDPRGSLSLSISSDAIFSANTEVSRALEESGKKKRRGPYTNYSSELRAQIGKYASSHGTTAATQYFTRKLKEPISKSTVQSIKKSYKQELLRSRRSAPLQQLLTKPRGRPLLLGQKLDSLVQLYMKRVRDGGGIINTRIAEAAARGIVMQYDKEKLEVIYKLVIRGQNRCFHK